MRRLLVALVLAGAAAAQAAPTAFLTSIDGAANVSVPPPAGQEAKLLEDAKDGRLDRFDLATAALIASGVDDASLERERERLLSAVARAQAQAKTQKTEKKRGDRLLRALHDTVLRRYVELQSRVDTVAQTGEFNCLSSAVVFAVAAEGILDAPRGMLSLTHAFVRVDVDKRPADVETTAAAGFAVDRRTLVTREFLRARGIGDGLTEEERLKDLQTPEEVSLVGLVAALYSNRGVLAVRQGDLTGAATAFDRAQRISTGELRARVSSWRAALLNNAVVGLLNDQRYDDARRLIRLGLDGAEGKERRALLQNLAAAAVAQAEQAKAAGRIADAIAHCDDALATGALSGVTRGQVQALRAELVGRQAKGDQGECLALARPAERATCLTSVALDLDGRGRSQESLDAARAASAVAVGSARERALGVHYNALLKVLERENAGLACANVEGLVRELDAVRSRMKEPPRVDIASQLAQCHWQQAQRAVERDDLDDAAASFARAAVHLPRDEALKKNRAEVELRRAERLARAGDCDGARPLVRRAESLRRGDRERGRSMLAFCANQNAGGHAKAERFAEAVAELRRGLADAPDDPSLNENLGRMLHNEAVSALRARRCDDALALVPELEERKKPIASDVKRVCGRP